MFQAWKYIFKKKSPRQIDNLLIFLKSVKNETLCFTFGKPFVDYAFFVCNSSCTFSTERINCKLNSGLRYNFFIFSIFFNRLQKRRRFSIRLNFFFCIYVTWFLVNQFWWFFWIGFRIVSDWYYINLVKFWWYDQWQNSGNLQFLWANNRNYNKKKIFYKIRKKKTTGFKKIKCNK